ncbi:Chromatin assembly factor 1, subunit A [Branchiostoma belcheri]|nr:Chromatin assembly factor 1, subunit A [Branchiostoma belcheri]
MLGECMPQNPSRMGDSKAEKVADGRSQDKNILSSPPSSKKLKQARLPFKVVSPLNGPMSPNTPNTKKRKHSNEEVASPKTPKLSSIHSPCKSAEKVSNQQLKEKEKSKASVVENAAKSVHEGENEVSSSSEMFPAPKSPAIKATSKNEKAKTIDSFLQTTQQPLVSTSNEDEVMMIDLAMTDSDPEEEMAGKQASPVCTPQVQEAVEAERCSPSVASSLQKNEGQSDVQESDTISMAIESVIQSSTVSSVEVTKTQPEEEAVASKNDQSPDSSNKAVSSTQATTSPPTHKESSPVSKSILDMFRYAEDRKAERNKDMPEDQETMPQHTSKDEVVKVTSPVHGKPEGCTSESSPVKAEVEASKDKITSPPTPSFTSPKGPSTKPRVKTPKQLAREAEQQKKREEKARKQQKVKAAFQSFFVKPKVDPAETKEEQQPVGAFMPFEVKKDMKLAPCVRVENIDLTRVDQGLQKQSCTELYLAELKKHHVPKTAGKTFPRPSPNSLEADDVMVVESSPPTRRVRMKLLQFHENYRPAYYGTWNKTSKQLNPRNPFKKDEDLLDYEFDSDDEWEEEEPGESISHSEGEKDDSDEDADSDLEDFFVPHGHLSEDEGCEDEDEPSSPSARKAKELARQRAFEADRKKQMKYMKAVVIGCLWSCDITEDNQSDIRRTLEEYKVCAFTTMPIHVAGPEESIAAVDKTPKQKGSKSSPGLNTVDKAQSAFPDLIRLMHGNPKGIKSLVREFREFWYLKQKGKNKDESGNKVDNKEQKSAEVAMETSEIVPSGPDVEMKEADSASNQTAPQQHKYSISKRQLEMTMMSIAVREKRADYHKTCWYVHQEVQTKHNITDLPIPNKWTYVTKQKSDSPKSRGATPGSAGAKKDTPAKDERPVTPSVPGANIRQFVQPMSPAALFKSPQQKEQEKQATPTTSPGPAGILNFFKKAGKAKESGKEDAGYHADSEDDDCMIVEEASTPPPKSVSSQSTGAASSSGNNSCLPKEASEKAGDTEVLQVRDGTSQDVSFVKTQTSSGQEAMEVTLH